MIIQTRPFIKSFFEFLLPHRCIFCGDKSNRQIDLCEGCEEDLPFITTACDYCGLPTITGTSICGQCITTPPNFNHTFSLLEYQPPITRLIYDLKFNHKLDNAKILSQLMIKHLRLTQKPDCIIPVPLHTKRLRERGFNQAVEIARPIARYFKIPLDIHSCKRTVHTKAQATIPAEERKRNLSNAFKLSKNFSAQHVIIFDDVVTTGNTVQSLAKTLKMSGVKWIEVWCCARTKLAK